MLGWAAIWKPLPKVVFSTTLSAVQGNARLASRGLAEEIERLRAMPGVGDIAIGGATLAAEAAALGPIDEYRARVHPVLVGGGIPYFPQHDRRVDLELVETRLFTSNVVSSWHVLRRALGRAGQPLARHQSPGRTLVASRRAITVQSPTAGASRAPARSITYRVGAARCRCTRATARPWRRRTGLPARERPRTPSLWDRSADQAYPQRDVPPEKDARPSQWLRSGIERELRCPRE